MKINKNNKINVSSNEELQKTITQVLDDNPICLNKTFLKKFLNDLYDNKHYIYALLDYLPMKLFFICRYYDHCNARFGWDLKETPDCYSLKEFCAEYRTFHIQDRFSMFFDINIYHFQEEVTISSIEAHYLRFLQTRCERGLQKNQPIELTWQIIHDCKLTDKDAVRVNHYLQEFTSAATSKLQSEYDRLKNLDCILK